VGERRERVIFWSLAALLVAATAAAYLLVVGPAPGSGGRGAAPVVRAPEPDATPLRLVLRAVSGDVTVVRRGTASPARPGDGVRPGDALETAIGAHAELGEGPFAIALSEGTRLALREADPARARLRLEAGLVEARAEGAARVEVEVPPGGAARAGGGTLWVSRAGGVTAAAVRGGEGELRSAVGAVSLGDGQRASAADGASPSGATAIPTALPLDVRWPPPRARKARVTVAGSTAPGALLIVAGERVDVRPDGTFAREVLLRDGPQRLEARAEDVGGLKAAREQSVTLDARAPLPSFDTKGLWRGR
jgi:hypothetical protein